MFDHEPDPTALYDGSDVVVVRVSRRRGLSLQKVLTDSVDLPLEIAMYLHFDTAFSPAVYRRGVQALREAEINPSVPLIESHLLPYVEETCSEEVLEAYKRLPVGQFYTYLHSEIRLEHSFAAARTVGLSLEQTVRTRQTM